MKPSLLTKLSRTLIQGHCSQPDILKLSFGVIQCFTWHFDDHVYSGSASDFVADNWNAARDAGIWVFLQQGLNGISEEGIIDDWLKVRLVPGRTLDIQIAVLKALSGSSQRICEVVALFEKLHSIVRADLYSVSVGGLYLKTPGPLNKQAITLVIEDVLKYRRRYISSDLSEEQEVTLMKRGGGFLLPL